jgi:hypothetical protein
MAGMADPTLLLFIAYEVAIHVLMLTFFASFYVMFVINVIVRVKYKGIPFKKLPFAALRLRRIWITALCVAIVSFILMVACGSIAGFYAQQDLLKWEQCWDEWGFGIFDPSSRPGQQGK